jgi:nucleotide-binding universal stress UspA family protein
MYNKILVPLDGSEFAECALDHVKTIAVGCKAGKVVLLDVREPIPQESSLKGMLGEDFVKKAEAEAKNYAVSYLTKKSEELRSMGINVEIATKDGIAADVILEYAKKESADLIIMTTHGRSGIARWALGSVAEKVIRHSNAPILVVAPKTCRVSP